MKYLNFYNECIINRGLPFSGLCSCLNAKAERELNHLFKPNSRDWDGSYWAYDGKDRNFLNNYGDRSKRSVLFKFTPLRQNIVLFLAAMNNEL